MDVTTNQDKIDSLLTPYNYEKPILDSPIILVTVPKENSLHNIQKTIKFAKDINAEIILSAGNTNLTYLSSSMTASKPIVYLKFSRVMPVVNVEDKTITVSGASQLGSVHDQCRLHNLRLKFDISAQNSEVFGLISTAAGGNQTGIASLLKKVTFVDGNGDVHCINQEDIQQSYLGHSTFPTSIVGSQGTFGIITKAVLQLDDIKPYQTTVVMPVSKLDKLQTFFEAIRHENLESCELIHKNCLQAIDSISNRTLDFDTPYALLVDWKSISNQEEDIILSLMESLEESDCDLISFVDNKIWDDRHHISDGARKFSKNNDLIYKGFDLSIPNEIIHKALHYLERKCSYLQITPFFFGHCIQQDNHIVMHINVASRDPESFDKLQESFDFLFNYKGVMSSGEHGGLSGNKQKLLNSYKSAGHHNWIKFLNQKFDYDPHNIFRSSLTENAISLLPESVLKEFIINKKI